MISNCSFVRFLYIALCFGISATPAYAWWSDEHRVITLIAEKHLTRHSRDQINFLIGGESLATLSLWADQIKSQQSWAHTRSWHYVNTERGQSFSSYQPKTEGDILWALTHFYKKLSNGQLSLQRRRQALLFFIHFAGDIHQPLHVGIRADRGGNKVPVIWYERSKSFNLHQVWDGLLTKNDLSSAENAQRLLKGATEQKISQWQHSSFTDWARESQQLLNNVYRFKQSDKKAMVPNLGDQYLLTNRPVAEERLLQAGIRIAYYLNQAFIEK